MNPCHSGKLTRYVDSANGEESISERCLCTSCSTGNRCENVKHCYNDGTLIGTVSATTALKHIDDGEILTESDNATTETAQSQSHRFEFPTHKIVSPVRVAGVKTTSFCICPPHTTGQCCEQTRCGEGAIRMGENKQTNPTLQSFKTQYEPETGYKFKRRKRISTRWSENSGQTEKNRTEPQIMSEKLRRQAINGDSTAFSASNDSCSCLPGGRQYGRFCQHARCANGGEEDGLGGCRCRPNRFHGQFCKDIACLHNGSVLESSLHGYPEFHRCACKGQFYGRHCELLLCANGGSHTEGEPHCRCNILYVGQQCTEATNVPIVLIYLFVAGFFLLLMALVFRCFYRVLRIKPSIPATTRIPQFHKNSQRLIPASPDASDEYSADKCREKIFINPQTRNSIAPDSRLGVPTVQCSADSRTCSSRGSSFSDGESHAEGGLKPGASAKKRGSLLIDEVSAFIEQHYIGKVPPPRADGPSESIVGRWKKAISRKKSVEQTHKQSFASITMKLLTQNKQGEKEANVRESQVGSSEARASVAEPSIPECEEHCSTYKRLTPSEAAEDSSGSPWKTNPGVHNEPNFCEVPTFCDNASIDKINHRGKPMPSPPPPPQFANIMYNNTSPCRSLEQQYCYNGRGKIQYITPPITTTSQMPNTAITSNTNGSNQGTPNHMFGVSNAEGHAVPLQIYTDGIGSNHVDAQFTKPGQTSKFQGPAVSYYNDALVGGQWLVHKPVESIIPTNNDSATRTTTTFKSPLNLLKSPKKTQTVKAHNVSLFYQEV